jgi:hypothetical protein
MRLVRPGPATKLCSQVFQSLWRIRWPPYTAPAAAAGPRTGKRAPNLPTADAMVHSGYLPGLWLIYFAEGGLCNGAGLRRGGKVARRRRRAAKMKTATTMIQRGTLRTKQKRVLPHLERREVFAAPGRGIALRAARALGFIVLRLFRMSRWIAYSRVVEATRRRQGHRCQDVRFLASQPLASQ